MLVLQLGSFVEALPFNLLLLEQLIFLPAGLLKLLLLLLWVILFADDVYVKTGGALRSNHIAPNGGAVVTVDTNLAVQNAYLATNAVQPFGLTTVSFLNNISMATETNWNRYINGNK